jgi:hypothetical protein
MQGSVYSSRSSLCWGSSKLASEGWKRVRNVSPGAAAQGIAKAVGYALEDLYPDRLANHYEELAHHFMQGDAWEKAFDYLVLAGDKEKNAYANQTAILRPGMRWKSCTLRVTRVAP